MASNSNVNKVVYGGATLIDLTGDDATAADVRSGKKFHLKSGAQGTGSMTDGSAATPNTSITSTPSISVSSAGLITASHSASKSITPSVSPGYVSSGTAGTVSTSGSATKQLTTKAAATITPGTSDQTIAAGTYLTGAQTIKGDSNLKAENIKSGVSIFGIDGSYEGDSGTPKNIKVIPASISTDITVGSHWAPNGTSTVSDSKYARTPKLAPSTRKAMMLDDTAYKYSVYMYNSATGARPHKAYNNVTAGTILIIDPDYPAMTLNFTRNDGADISSSEASVIKSALHFYDVTTT